MLPRYNLIYHRSWQLFLSRKPAIDPRYTQFKLSIRESRIHRRGVYAEEPIPARRKVIEYTGETNQPPRDQAAGRWPVTYLFTLDDYWTLDGAFGGSGAEIINHSCDPNLRSMNIKGHILYMSKRAIRRGEELTVDYRFDKDIERGDMPLRRQELPRRHQPAKVGSRQVSWVRAPPENSPL